MGDGRLTLCGSGCRYLQPTVGRVSRLMTGMGVGLGMIRSQVWRVWLSERSLAPSAWTEQTRSNKAAPVEQLRVSRLVGC